MGNLGGLVPPGSQNSDPFENVILHIRFQNYLASNGFSLAWLLSITKSFASLFSLVVGLFYTPQKRRTSINSYDFLKFNFHILLPSYFL